MEYGYRKGTSYKVEANVVASELSGIRASDGLTASAVVEHARPEDAPLHPIFEWNDDVAGEKWREHQARNLIRSVVVLQPDSEETTPMFVHIPSVKRGAGEYETTEHVVERPDLFEIALSDAIRRLNSAKEAVDALERAAAGSDDAERLARIGMAAKAIQTAHDAVRALH